LANVNLVVHNTMSNEYGFDLNCIDSVKYNEVFKIYSKKPVICVSQGVAENFKKLFPAHQECYQIYNPINVDLINAYADDYDDIPYEDYIVHVGKFKQEKRHDILIKAYAKSNTNKLLVLVGQGALEGECRDLVAQLDLKDKVVFAGFHANPYPLIKNANLLVLSSDFEGLPTVLLESLALGTPAISSNCRSGPSEILPSSNLFPPGDIDSLAVLLSTDDYDVFYSEFSNKFNAKAIAEVYLTRS
jgi:glycosyltransferase involved in cell wall biosynthesis